jgi:hypothetical protein
MSILIFDILGQFYVFVTLMIGVAGGIGLMSGSMAVGSFSAYVMFSYYAITVDDTLLLNIFYVTLTMIFIGFAFKFWRLEGFGGGENA